MFAGVDGMKSVFMKCSYLSLSSGRVGTTMPPIQNESKRTVFSFFHEKSKQIFFSVPFIICLEMLNFDFKMIYLMFTKTVYYGNVGNCIFCR